MCTRKRQLMKLHVKLKYVADVHRNGHSAGENGGKHGKED